ncbi:hypothetical protein [Actinokineospora sp.]|uniref:hypothetical protein n=1 Tax=Actinokineospora sp. TaxID=1872133 RepID=UPI00403763AB
MTVTENMISLLAGLGLDAARSVPAVEIEIDRFDYWMNSATDMSLASYSAPCGTFVSAAGIPV